MRVLLANKFHWRKGGSETYYFALADALRAMGHEVAFFSMEDERNEPTEWSRFFVSNSDYGGGASPAAQARAAASLVYSPEAKRKFDALCSEFRPDAVHLNLVHRQLTLSILDAPYLREHPVPVVYTAHDYILVCPSYVMLDGSGEVCDACLDGRFRHCAARRCVKGSRAKSALAALEARFLRAHGSYRKIDRFVAPSEFMRGKLVEGGFPESRVAVMRNFAGEEVLARARAGGDRTGRERPYLLYFGRLSREKGVDVLVDAFLSAAGGMPGWRLVVAGEGPERAALEARLAAHPLGARVELVGFQRGEALRRLVEGASMAVVASRWRENAPYSVIEAFASGTPVVATRIGGLPELVEEGKTGFLAEPGDPGSLARAIGRAAALCEGGPGGYAAMQRRCRGYVAGNCDQSRYVERLVGLYREAADERKG